MLGGQRALVEILLHQGVVAFGHHLDQRFVGLLRRFRHIAGNLALFALAVSVGRVGVGFHLHQVDDTFEIALDAEGELDGNSCPSENRLYTFQRSVETGAFAIELIN